MNFQQPLIQTILDGNGQALFAILPWADYTKLVQQAAKNSEETMPFELTKRVIVDGENPIRVYREYRGISQSDLAKLAGISLGFLNRVEGNYVNASRKTLARLANAMNMDIGWLEKD